MLPRRIDSWVFLLVIFPALVGQPESPALQKKRGTLSGVPLSLFSVISASLR
jgi:hypothetical protein